MLNQLQLGGPILLLQTVQRNFRVKVDDYMVVNFDGFTEAINAAGGIELEIDADEADIINEENPDGWVEAGFQHLDGAQALTYARIRKIDSDFQRTQRQRNVVEALLGRMFSLDLRRTVAIAQSVLPYIETNMSSNELIGLVLRNPTVFWYGRTQLMLPIDARLRGFTFMRWK